MIPDDSIMSSSIDQHSQLLTNAGQWQHHVTQALEPQVRHVLAKTRAEAFSTTDSSVLLLLSPDAPRPGAPPEISLILTKRSRVVRQPGDLCCPGGAMEPRLDAVLAKLLLLPASPLARWPHWTNLRTAAPRQSRQLAILLATGLRESLEEIRLNPLRVRFLGVLPRERLSLFPRNIYPLVVWVERQRRFFPSWEVDRIVSIPVRKLLDPNNYFRYRLYVAPHLAKRYQRGTMDYPCLFHHDQQHAEILWGVTFRMVSQFLQLVLGFQPPDVSNRPFIPGLLDDGYINGRA
jgi:hypothetical protein